MKPYTLLMSQMPLRPEDDPPGFAAYVQPLLDARQRVLQRLSDEERHLCHQILETFFRCGRGPKKTSLHLRGNHLVTLNGDRATVYSHAYAWNRMEGNGDPL